MSYDYSINRVLAKASSSGELGASYIINHLLYRNNGPEEISIEKRLEPDQVQLLVNELLDNMYKMPGSLFATEEVNGNGMFITKGGVPILYMGRFLKGQFDNEAMVSTAYLGDTTFNSKVFETQIITRKYIIGSNGLFENNNEYFTFIDLVKGIENSNKRLPLHYFYYPNNNPNTRIFMDRQLGYRKVEETLPDGKVKSQVFKFNPNKLKADNIRIFSRVLSGDELLKAVYDPKPMEDITINYPQKPKTYQKALDNYNKF